MAQQGGLISRRHFPLDTLPEILLIKMTIAFSWNIWYFLVLLGENISHRVIVHPPLNPLPRGDFLYSPLGRGQGWVPLLSSKGGAELLLIHEHCQKQQYR